MTRRDPKARGNAPGPGTSDITRASGGYRAAAANRKGEDLQWSVVERLRDGIISDCVDAVTSAGDAVQFGRSRDGGAYSITLYTPAGRVVVWANTPAQAVEELETIIEDARLLNGE